MKKGYEFNNANELSEYLGFDFAGYDAIHFVTMISVSKIGHYLTQLLSDPDKISITKLILSKSDETNNPMVYKTTEFKSCDTSDGNSYIVVKDCTSKNVSERTMRGSLTMIDDKAEVKMDWSMLNRSISVLNNRSDILDEDKDKFNEFINTAELDFGELHLAVANSRALNVNPSVSSENRITCIDPESDDTISSFIETAEPYRNGLKAFGSTIELYMNDDVSYMIWDALAGTGTPQYVAFFDRNFSVTHIGINYKIDNRFYMIDRQNPIYYLFDQNETMKKTVWSNVSSNLQKTIMLSITETFELALQEFMMYI